MVKKELPDKPEISSDISERQSKQRSQLVRHSRNHTRKRTRLYSCNVCSKQLKSSRGLLIHLRIHTGERPCCCFTCGKEFGQSSHLYRHQRDHCNLNKTGESNKFDCLICKKWFSRKDALTRHTLIHKRHRRIKQQRKCGFCDKDSMCKLNSKCQTDYLCRRNIITNDTHVCSICHKKFASKDNLFRHELIHTGEKPYKCEFCSSSFRQKADLKKHTLIHTMAKSDDKCDMCLKCDVCSKLFVRKSSLQRHLYVHSENKPHRCQFCDKQFIRKSQLVQHMYKHNGKSFSHSTEIRGKSMKIVSCVQNIMPPGSKLIQCDVCSKFFTSDHALEDHSRIHSGDNMYYCDICTKYVLTYSALCAHKRRHPHTNTAQ